MTLKTRMKRASVTAAGVFLLGAGQTWASSLVGVTFDSTGGAPQWTNETTLGTTNNLLYETGVNSGFSLTTSVTGGLASNPVTLAPPRYRWAIPT